MGVNFLVACFVRLPSCLGVLIGFCLVDLAVAHPSPVPSLALRIGSNDQRDGSQCCPSFGGCPRGHHSGVEPAAPCASTRENSPGSDLAARIDRFTAHS